MNWVIIFVRSGVEEKVVSTNNVKFKTNGFMPFVPTRETRFKNKGVVEIVRKPLFPGYIFLRTEIDVDEIPSKLFNILHDMRNVYSVLHYGDNKQDVVVRKHESANWSRLFDNDFCILGSVGFIEGDTVKVVSGALMGREVMIKKIIRHQQKAIVEMEMMGVFREVSLLLEVVEKVI